MFGSYCLVVTDFILRVSGATGGFFQNLDLRQPVGRQDREESWAFMNQAIIYRY
jgi:hypothetical protein